MTEFKGRLMEAALFNSAESRQEKVNCALTKHVL